MVFLITILQGKSAYFSLQFELLAQLFSEKTRDIIIALTFSNISYYQRYLFETGNMCSLTKEQSMLSRETIQNA